MTYDIHQFMCPLCGKETIPVARRSNQKRPKGHRKWLFCPWCHKSVNTYECRNDIELMEFKEQFASGEITKAYDEEMRNIDPKYIHS